MAEKSRKKRSFERSIIAIIAILAAMLLPALNKARDKAKEAACTGNQKSIQLATSLYQDTYNDHFPALDENDYRRRTSSLAEIMGMKRLLKKDSGTGLMIPISNVTPQLASIFLCPADNEHRKSSKKIDMLLSYGYNYFMTHIINPGESSSNYAVKRGLVIRPAEKIYVSDFISIDTTTMAYKLSSCASLVRNGYPFTVPPTYAGAMHFRHGNNAITGYADGHVGQRQLRNTINTTSKYVAPR